MGGLPAAKDASHASQSSGIESAHHYAPPASGWHSPRLQRSSLTLELQTSAFSHSFSFSSAFPRWLTAFLSFFGISAYVRPLYSKHESQPKSVGPRDGTSLPCTHPKINIKSAVSGSDCIDQREKDERVGKTYMCSSLKDDDVLPRPLAVRKRADSLRALVLEAGEQLVEIFGAEGFEEPFAVARMSAQDRYNRETHQGKRCRGVGRTVGRDSRR